MWEWLKRVISPPPARIDYQCYYYEWLDEHDRQTQKPGNFADKVWETTTPDWDRRWFRSHGYTPPRMVDPSQCYWKDIGEGLRKRSFR